MLVDPTTTAVQRIVALQHNPGTLSRTLQVQGVGGEGGDRFEPLRLKGPPIDRDDQIRCGDRYTEELSRLGGKL